MQTRRLGRTGHESTIAILGGAAFGRSDEEETAAAFASAIAAGVNHLDIAPQYGLAEVLVGPHVPSVRDRLFVACKTLRKNVDGVKAQAQESLEKLHVDRFDLYQAHAVTSLEVLEERMAALGEIVRMRDEGLTRFAGITGHDLTVPATFVEALRRFDLDTVMFPVNARLWADADYRRDAETLLALCAERDIGVMAIKAGAARPWGDREKWATSWYEPRTDIETGVRFTLSVPGVHAFATPGDVAVTALAIDAASRFTPMSPDEMEAAMDAVRDEPHIFPIATHAR
ncbi:MAG TPA: aldo/keto reductase [Acidimicrobiales bacterium]|nr:aldo/keto reductase [Acidimicrobiales bacterium]